MFNFMFIEHYLSILGGFNKNMGILLGGCLTCEELRRGFLTGGGVWGVNHSMISKRD